MWENPRGSVEVRNVSMAQDITGPVDPSRTAPSLPASSPSAVVVTSLPCM